jgi:Staphylococcal nuclease homologue
MHRSRLSRKYWTGRHWGRRNRLSYVKVALIFVFAIVIIFVGRDHGHRWRSVTSDEPFPPTVTGNGQPIDGDSLWVGGEEVRLKGIDAPEWKQDCERDGARWMCGEIAREELVRGIGDDKVTCTISQRDVYGRMLGNCSAGGRDLNAGMVASGMAVAFGGYESQQAKARAERRGLWAGDFEKPRDWRAEHASENER